MESRTITEEKKQPQDGEGLTDDKYGVVRSNSLVTKEGEVVNASGYRDQLQRQYSLLSVCGLALTIDNAWIALGGSISVSIRE